jgi:LPXTG-motif cell wall-anchored protein
MVFGFDSGAVYGPTRIGRPRRSVPAPRGVTRAAPGRNRRGPGRSVLGGALCACGAAMVPWLFVLARELPKTATAAHWSATWVGLDALEAIGLGTTGLLLRRRDPRAALAASVTATLLLVDAWFDVMTAATGAERATAAAMALGIELPLAALLAVVALRTHRQQMPTGPDDLGPGGDHLGHPGP